MPSAGKMEDISSFGHSCTLFNNPAASEWVNSRRSLVEWHGVFVDKFDARHLLDIIDCERQKSDHDISREELLVEIKCDVERYFDLDEDKEAEGDLSLLLEGRSTCSTDDPRGSFSSKDDVVNDEEEEIKKRYMGAAFSYTYAEEDSPTIPIETRRSESSAIDTELAPRTSTEDFPEEMALPVGIIKPATQTQLEILLRTAKFLSTQPLQMEIMLKAKQSGNANFSFLTFGDALNPFYKHIITRIRSGEYIPTPRPVATISGESSPAPPGGAASPATHSTHSSVQPVSKLSLSADKPGLVDYDEDSEDSDNDDVGGGEADDAIDRSVAVGNTACSPPGACSSGEKSSTTGNGTLVNVTTPPESTESTFGDIAVPPADIKQIVDKLAIYVAKNGETFAESVWAKSKDDARFQFLSAGHEHHAYYLSQVAAARNPETVTDTAGSDRDAKTARRPCAADDNREVTGPPDAAVDTEHAAAKKRQRLERAKAFLASQTLHAERKSVESTTSTSSTSTVTPAGHTPALHTPANPTVSTAGSSAITLSGKAGDQSFSSASTGSNSTRAPTDATGTKKRTIREVTKDTARKQHRANASSTDVGTSVSNEAPSDGLAGTGKSSKRSKKRARFKFADTKEESIQPPPAKPTVTLSTSDLLEKLKQARTRR
eukprot:m.1637570 g.1637570  ORF g.1637570 m.1637570 type:complete len:660 (+) comp25947_c0_seq1:320-2299(+)